MWVVRVALQRPYSFVVLALLIAIFGVLAALNTPTDIFPSLNIPVVSVVWTDNGLLPNDMSGREPASLAPEPGRAADQVLRRRLSALKPPRAAPADVLRNRPDVAEGERLTAAASELIGASRANFFPRVTLLALGGTQDTKFRLFQAINLFGSVGPSIDIPLFDAGLRQAELEIAKAQFTQAGGNYRATVLRALQEVQDELSSSRWLAEEYDQTTTAAVAARKAADLSLTLYRDGASSYLDVVTAQSAALEAEGLAIALHTRQLTADIGLMLALGGGWTAPPEPRAKPGLAPYLAE
jgi:outer membrane protein TolC